MTDIIRQALEGIGAIVIIDIDADTQAVIRRIGKIYHLAYCSGRKITRATTDSYDEAVKCMEDIAPLGEWRAIQKEKRS